ncbi:MAG: DMT family transporter [Prevotella sp.]|nr:DMT family transporter [Prevotella sp.]
MKSATRGAVCGVVAAVAYGMNPLFSLNLFACGMDVESVLFYRYAIATVILAAVFRLRGMKIGVSRREALPLALGGLIFALSSHTLYESFMYMDAGVACSILFIYPILVAVIMMLFFHERASLLTYGCIMMATAGVALLCRGDGSGEISMRGLLLVMASSLCYAVYIVGADHSALSRVPSSRMTLWMLIVGAVTFWLFTSFGTRLCAVPSTPVAWFNVVGMALIPTVIPILFINIAIKNVGPTFSAIIGALEPVTALIIGVTVFGERLTMRIVSGALLILVAVLLVIARPLLVRLIHHSGSHVHDSDSRRPQSPA